MTLHVIKQHCATTQFILKSYVVVLISLLAQIASK